MIVAGEASGDAHAAELVAELKCRHPELHVFGCGGERLQAAGCELLVRAEELAVVGLFEVVAHLPRIFGYYRRLRRALRQRRPQAVILVDFPDFNLRLARAARRAGVPVIYFISPQLWAWRSGRVKIIQRTVRRMICIFPFEPEFYARRGVEVAGVGHPLVERVAAARAALPVAQPGAPRIALLPGSRRREVAFHLPVMVAAARQLRQQHGPELEFVIPVAPTLHADDLRAALGEPWPEWLHLVSAAQGYAVVAQARLAVVASGTATVETALLGKPMIVIYRLSPWTYRLGRRFVKTPHYAMVNLIAGERAVPELIQEGCNADAIVHWANRLLPEGRERQLMIDALQRVGEKLGGPGAIARAATAVEEALELAPSPHPERALT